ncbi:MAG: CoA transferase [Deltaproteobacteria bacterium]|nr:CoA transferase [Deltaproteobacteria bacterium]
MSGALQDLRIVDLTNVGPGAHCVKILADLGADVVRVAEAASVLAKRGRSQWKAPFWAYGMRRNTKVLGLDLKSAAGLGVFRRLATQADVVMVGLRPAAAERLGVHYDALRQLNPRLVYACLTGYGATGPYREVVGHDINYQAIGGTVGMTGGKDGPPVIPGATAADSAGGGMHAAIAILAAIVARQHTGRGQYVDVSATDGIVNMMSVMIDEYLSTGVEPRRGATLLTGEYPWYTLYETADGKYISVGAIEPWFYQNLCRLMGMEDLIPHQYAEGVQREDMFRRFRETFRTKTCAEWVALLMHADTCVAPVHTIADLVNDPHLRERGMIRGVAHPTRGMVEQTGIMVRMSDTPGTIRNVDPQPGEFTEAILRDAGYTPAQIRELREAGVVD